MQRPQLTDFGLSDANVAEIDRYENENLADRVWWGRLVGAAGLLSGFSFAPLDWGIDERIFLAFCWGLAGLTAGHLFFISISFALLHARGSFSVRVRAYRKFKEVLQEFEAWELRAHEAFWRSLSGQSFEIELARLFERQGYSTELTPASGDKGVDIILRRSGKTTLVQCKQTQTPVNPAVARELYGALVAYRGATNAVLASIGGVTSGVRKFVSDKPILILELSDIIAMQRTLKPSNG